MEEHARRQQDRSGGGGQPDGSDRAAHRGRGGSCPACEQHRRPARDAEPGEHHRGLHGGHGSGGGADREHVVRTVRTALEQGCPERRLQRHHDAEQPQRRQRAAGEPQEPHLAPRVQVSGGMGQHQVREHQRHQTREHDPDAEQNTVARPVQEPQRRQQADGDQQPAHPSLDLARLRVQPRRDQRHDHHDSELDREPGGLGGGVLGGQQPDGRGRAHAEHRDAGKSQGQGHRRPQPHETRRQSRKRGRARTGSRFGVLERAPLSLARCDLGTHDVIPRSVSCTWAVVVKRQVALQPVANISPSGRWACIRRVLQALHRLSPR